MADAPKADNLMEQIALEYVHEQRRKRQWGIFFKSVFALIALLSVLSLFFIGPASPDLSKPHTALIDINGVIMDSSKASADNIAQSLHHAYKDKGTKGIILRINSPGGSPVQASYIFNEIRRQKKKHPDIKVYAVCVDVCASAAYYIAAAADDIYADPSSIVGSIGVLYNGFGFTGTMEKLGVERRLITAGKNKGFMDPFSPIKAGQKELLDNMLESVHADFINSVKEGRGKRLKQDPVIFSGLFWSGRKAKDLGLVDQFGSTGMVARDVIKEDKIIDYTMEENFFERVAKKFGAELPIHIGDKLGLRSQSPVLEQLM